MKHAAIVEAAQILKEGGVVLAPTDTVYGLLCRADNAKAVKRILAMKRRRDGKAMPILVASRAQASRIAHLPPHALKLARHFWPGPHTLIMKARCRFPRGVAAQDGSIGVRLPQSVALRALARRAGGPLVATSANISGKSPARTMRAALGGFRKYSSPFPDLAIDGGTLTASPSTIIDLLSTPPRVIRGTVPRRRAKLFRISS